MSPGEQYLLWRKQPAVGCFFARTIANHPNWYGQKIECVTGTGTPDLLAGVIASKITAAVADVSASAAAVLLPDIVTLEAAAMVLLALGSQPDWNVTTSVLQDPPAGEMVAVHIIRSIPFGGATCPSEALVLGPFSEFPATRRSPIAALEVYVGQPRTYDPKTGNPTTKTNLAHIEMNLPTQAAFEKIWNMSVDGRTRSLGGNDSRAKAKVSFVIPMALAQQLGCAP
jgi:hypothetical protein